MTEGLVIKNIGNTINRLVEKGGPVSGFERRKLTVEEEKKLASEQRRLRIYQNNARKR